MSLILEVFPGNIQEYYRVFNILTRKGYVKNKNRRYDTFVSSNFFSQDETPFYWIIVHKRKIIKK